MPKVNLKSLSPRELESCLLSLGEKKYRATQVFRWIWQKGEDDPLNFSDIPRSLRQQLRERASLLSLEIRETIDSSDGSIKLIFGLPDGLEIEAVFIPEGQRRTVFLSTQVGCPLACRFCASGKYGWKRNLEAWEIQDQLLAIKRFLGSNDDKKRPVTNVVFMGIGEPFLNIANTLSSIGVIRSPHGLGIGARRITLSTAGIVPGIYELAQQRIQVKLAISLHTGIQEKREELMPIARQYPLSELKKACPYYMEKKNKRITFEVIQIPGMTDSEEDIRALQRFLQGLFLKVNIIPYNPFPQGPFRAPSREEIDRFLKRVQNLPFPVTLRRSKGSDIQAACGQLALKRLNPLA